MIRLVTQSFIELFFKLFAFLSNRRFAKLETKDISFSLLKPHYSAPHISLKKLIKTQLGLSGFHLLENNHDAFAARFHLINTAELTLDLQYYYFNGDTSGRLIAQALLKAADRGVRVRLLLDDIDTLGADEALRLINSHAQIEVRIFNPFYFRGLLRYLEFITDMSRVGRRMHNKAMVADNSLAIIGGRNIGDIYFSADPDLLFLDIDLLSMGEIVKEISVSFDEYWNSRWAVPVNSLYSRPDKVLAVKRTREFLKKYVKDVKQTNYIQALNKSVFNQLAAVEDLPLVWSAAQFFYDKPDKIDFSNYDQDKRIRNNLYAILTSAKNDLSFISPYFIPGKEGLQWFSEMVSKGVAVSVFTNSLAATDVTAVHAGYASYRQALLAAGVKLYELKPSAYIRERKKFKIFRAGSKTSLHAKTIIIDQQEVFIGSPNLDPRSKDLNTEMGLLVNNETLAQLVVEKFGGEVLKQNSYQLKLETLSAATQESVIEKRIVWSSEDEGVKTEYYSEPEASLWRRISVRFYSLLPIEELL